MARRLLGSIEYGRKYRGLMKAIPQYSPGVNGDGQEKPIILSNASPKPYP
jgi:hypothetical protein